jgi:carbon monoxide dehydrogenase subunit G
MRWASTSETMKVQLEKTFALPASADAAWACCRTSSGGRLRARREDHRAHRRPALQGHVAVKFGPASMSFRGEVEVMALEPRRKTCACGKGTDTTGSSGAAMDLTARVEAIDASSCRLRAPARCPMSGKAAAFGSRLMGSVADQVLKQFGDASLVQVQAAAGAGTRRRGKAAAAPEPEPRPRSSSTAWPWSGRSSRTGCARCSRRSGHERRMTFRRAQELAAWQQDLARAGYIAEPGLVAALLLMIDLDRPLLLEAMPASARPRWRRCLATLRRTRLIRLQCYEGLDAHAALYEWNYQRQLLAIKLLEHDERGIAQKEQDIFSERYLLKRRCSRPSVATSPRCC